MRCNGAEGQHPRQGEELFHGSNRRDGSRTFRRSLREVEVRTIALNKRRDSELYIASSAVLEPALDGGNTCGQRISDSLCLRTLRSKKNNEMSCHQLSWPVGALVS